MASSMEVSMGFMKPADKIFDNADRFGRLMLNSPKFEGEYREVMKLSDVQPVDKDGYTTDYSERVRAMSKLSTAAARHFLKEKRSCIVGSDKHLAMCRNALVCVPQIKLTDERAGPSGVRQRIVEYAVAKCRSMQDYFGLVKAAGNDTEVRDFAMLARMEAALIEKDYQKVIDSAMRLSDNGRCHERAAARIVTPFQSRGMTDQDILGMVADKDSVMYSHINHTLKLDAEQGSSYSRSTYKETGSFLDFLHESRGS